MLPGNSIMATSSSLRESHEEFSFNSNINFPTIIDQNMQAINFKKSETSQTVEPSSQFRHNINNITSLNTPYLPQNQPSCYTHDTNLKKTPFQGPDYFQFNYASFHLGNQQTNGPHDNFSVIDNRNNANENNYNTCPLNSQVNMNMELTFNTDMYGLAGSVPTNLGTVPFASEELDETLEPFEMLSQYEVSHTSSQQQQQQQQSCFRIPLL